jgi:hypothetical protein
MYYVYEELKIDGFPKKRSTCVGNKAVITFETSFLATRLSPWLFFNAVSPFYVEFVFKY